MPRKIKYSDRLTSRQASLYLLLDIFRFKYEDFHIVLADSSYLATHTQKPKTLIRKSASTTIITA